MEEGISCWEQKEQILGEDTVLSYEEYSDFNEDQNGFYQELFTDKILKNDSIKFY